MTNPVPPAGDPELRAGYEIRIRGHLGDAADARFAQWTVSREADGATRLSAHAVDQAALHGVLKRVRDLGAPLLSLTRLAPEAPVSDAPAPREDDAATRRPAPCAARPLSEEDPRV